MGRIIGYGVSVRNTKENDVSAEQTIPAQELESLGYTGQMQVVEIVRSMDDRRPMLDKIIEEFTADDMIALYSINTLFKGKKNRGLEYYSKILDKGIGLQIFDFSGAAPRMSKYSTVSFECVPYQFNKGQLIEMLRQDVENVSASVGKKIRSDMDFYMGLLDSENPSNVKAKAFKEIYFAYEAYQLSSEDTEKLLEKYCGIATKVTFWRVAADFERTFAYADSLMNFCCENGTSILDYPKRCGGVPSEYYEIRSFAESLPEHLSDRKKIETAIKELRLGINVEIYYRWHLAECRAKRPRNTLPGFSLEDFRSTHQTI